MEYSIKIQHHDVSFDQAFPNERSFGAAIATTSGMLLTVIISFSLSLMRHKFMYSFGTLFTTNLFVIIWVTVFVQSDTLNLSLSFCILSGAMTMFLILILNFNQSPAELKPIFKSFYNKIKLR